MKLNGSSIQAIVNKYGYEDFFKAVISYESTITDEEILDYAFDCYVNDTEDGQMYALLNDEAFSKLKDMHDKKVSKHHDEIEELLAEIERDEEDMDDDMYDEFGDEFDDIIGETDMDNYDGRDVKSNNESIPISDKVNTFLKEKKVDEHVAEFKVQSEKFIKAFDKASRNFIDSFKNEMSNKKN